MAASTDMARKFLAAVCFGSGAALTCGIVWGAASIALRFTEAHALSDVLATSELRRQLLDIGARASLMALAYFLALATHPARICLPARPFYLFSGIVWLALLIEFGLISSLSDQIAPTSDSLPRGPTLTMLIGFLIAYLICQALLALALLIGLLELPDSPAASRKYAWTQVAVVVPVSLAALCIVLYEPIRQEMLTRSWNSRGFAVALRYGQLVELRATDAEIGDGDLAQIVAEPQLLIRLDLSGTRVTDAGLAELKRCYYLQKLDLADTPVAGPGLEQIDCADDLTTLILAGTKIDGPGLEHVARFIRLNSLDLSRTAVDDAGLAMLVRLPFLKKLRLVDTPITDQGLEPLSACSDLATLDLSGTKITDEGLAHLAIMTSLRSLDLSNTAVTAEGAKQLQAELPLCQVTRRD